MPISNTFSYSFKIWMEIVDALTAVSMPILSPLNFARDAKASKSGKGIVGDRLGRLTYPSPM